MNSNSQEIKVNAGPQTIWVIVTEHITGYLAPKEVCIIDEQWNGYNVAFGSECAFVHKDNVYDTEAAASARIAEIKKHREKKMKKQTIIEFQGEHRWLSNFWAVKIPYNGLTYNSVETAYQAAKCANEADKVQFQDMRPGPAKRLGREVEIRADWESIKLQTMLELLRIKFCNAQMRKLLLETEDRQLQEGNSWHDTFWGVDLRTGKGENNLGKLLMQVREEVQEK